MHTARTNNNGRSGNGNNTAIEALKNACVARYLIGMVCIAYIRLENRTDVQCLQCRRRCYSGISLAFLVTITGRLL